MKSDAALLMIAFVWGFSFVLVKEALTFISPFTFLFYRFFLSFLILLMISAKKLRVINANILKYGIFIGIALFFGYGFQTVGLQYTTPANAGFITGLSVVMVPFLSVALLKKRPDIYSFVGVFFAAAGLFFLLFQQLEMNYGDLLIVFCAFSFAMHIILVGKYVPSCDPLLLTTIQIGTVALLSYGFTGRGRTTMTPLAVEAVLITSLVATVAAFLIQNAAQRHVTPTRTAVIFATEPVFAALCSFFLNYEVFTVRKVGGCLLILVGILITEFKKRGVL